jgi:hypothetical protein
MQIIQMPHEQIEKVTTPRTRVADSTSRLEKGLNSAPKPFDDNKAEDHEEYH